MAKKNKKLKSKVKYQFTDSRIDSQIMGADFVKSEHNIEELERRILNGRNKDLEKIKVLFLSEASYLHTGFSTYTREVLTRLNKNPKLEVAELGSYGQSAKIEPKAASIPWRYYHNMPENQQEEQAYRQDYKDNQFGKWKFNQAILDFEPDVLLLHRDWWMDKFVFENKLHKKFSIIWMACVDSYPQQWEWLKSYSQADSVMAYSHFGKKVIQDQSRTKLAELNGITPIDVSHVCPGASAPDIFKPLNKDEVKRKYNIDPSIRIIGTVMRNQPRKLFTRLIESFSVFLKKHPNESANCMLLLHTGIPDVGFNIPESIHRYGVENRVIFSWKCSACGHNGVGRWGFVGQACPNCKSSHMPNGQPALTTPNSANGISEEKLNEIYNLMDLYVQSSICEGCGMPVNEAKMAGIPVACTDYSALYEKNRNGGGIPIKVKTMYTECETMQNRAIFDINDLANTMKNVISNPSLRMRLSQEARVCATNYYNWDLTAKKWEAEIMNVKLKGRKTWKKPSIGVCIVSNDNQNQSEFDKSFNSVFNNFDHYYSVCNQDNIDIKDCKLIQTDEIDFEKIAKDSNMESDWVLFIKSGEELFLKNGCLSTEAFYNNEIASRISLITFDIDHQGVLDFDKKIVQARFFNRIYQDSNYMPIICSNQQSAQLMNHQVSEIENGNESNLKMIYANLSHFVQNEIKILPHIRRKCE